MRWFTTFSKETSKIVGHPIAFIVAILVVVVWALSGPVFGFSDTWQLVVNTGTTIITFLMVFLIQNTQNRDTEALHLKLDELIRSHRPARNKYVNLEDLSTEELDELKKLFEEIEDSSPQAKQVERKVKKQREKKAG